MDFTYFDNYFKKVTYGVTPKKKSLNFSMETVILFVLLLYQFQ